MGHCFHDHKLTDFRQDPLSLQRHQMLSGDLSHRSERR